MISDQEQRIGYALALKDMADLAKELNESNYGLEAMALAAAVTYLLIAFVGQEAEDNCE